MDFSMYTDIKKYCDDLNALMCTVSYKINELEEFCKIKEELYKSMSNDIEKKQTNQIENINVGKTLQCKCKNIYNFSYDKFADGVYCFCGKDTEVNSIFDMQQCDNFKNFCSDLEILKQLFNNNHKNISNVEDIQKLFTPKAIVSNYDRNFMINMITIFIALIKLEKYAYIKCWICISMYDFVIRNWKFCKDNKNFRKVFMSKWVDEFVPNEPIFVDLGRKINPYFDQYTEFFKDNLEYDKMTLPLPQNSVDICLKELSSKIDNFIVSKL